MDTYALNLFSLALVIFTVPSILLRAFSKVLGWEESISSSTMSPPVILSFNFLTESQTTNFPRSSTVTRSARYSASRTSFVATRMVDPSSRSLRIRSQICLFPRRSTWLVGSSSIANFGRWTRTLETSNRFA